MGAAKQICIGELAGAHGVKGLVKLRSFCARPEDIFSYGPLSTVDGMWLYELKKKSQHKPGLFLAECPQIADRDEAEALKGTRLYVARDKLPETDEDEFYIEDLIGLEVRSIDQEVVARVKAVQNFGAGDIIEVIGLDENKAVGMYPFTREVVPVVNLTEGFIIIDPPKEIIVEPQKGEKP